MAKENTQALHIPVVSPPLAQRNGLRETCDLLREIDQLQDLVSRKAAGFGVPKADLKGVAEVEAALKRMGSKLGRELDPEKIFGNLKDIFDPAQLAAFRRAIADLRKESQFSPAFGPGGNFRANGAKTAAVLTEAQNRMAREMNDIAAQGYAALRDLLNGRVGPQMSPQQVSAVGKVNVELGSGALTLTIPPNRIQIELGDGNVKVTGPAAKAFRNQAGAAGSTASPSGEGGARPGTGRKSRRKTVDLAQAGLDAGDADVVRKEISSTGKKLVQRMTADLDTIVTKTDADGNSTSKKVIPVLRKAKDRITTALADAAAGIDRETTKALTGVKSNDFLARSKAASQLAGEIRLQLDDKNNAAAFAQSPTFRSRLERTAAIQERRVAEYRRKADAAAAEETQAAADRQAAEARARQAEATRVNAATQDALEQRRQRRKGDFAYALDQADRDRKEMEKWRKDEAKRNARSADASAVEVADATMASRERQRARRKADMEAALNTRYGNTPSTGGPPKAPEERNFITNTQTVTQWAASVAVFYKSVELANYGLDSFIRNSYEVARLGAVYRGIGGATEDLADDVLRLGAVNGRTAQEALQAATAWSRLGYSRAETAEATRAALVGANVAELTSLELTKHLQAATAAYGLTAGELSSYLGGLNAISNRYNVTNAEMLEGISRTASVAKQSGLSLEELRGITASVTAAMGQSGANVGNSIKSLITAIGNPALQKLLKSEFGITVKSGATGDLKDFSAILADLAVLYAQASKEEQQWLTVSIAGKTQAARFAATLQEYARGQVLAANALLNLNSAEAENAQIKKTLRAELAGLVTEFERFSLQQGNNGAAQAAAFGAETLRNLLALLNTDGVNKGVTVLAGLLVVLAARLAAIKLSADLAAGSRGLAASTYTGVARRVDSLSKSLGGLVNQFYQASQRGGTAARWMGQMAMQADAMSEGLIKAGKARASLGREQAGQMFRGGPGASPALPPELALAGRMTKGPRGAANMVGGVAQMGAGVAGRLALGGVLAFAGILPEIAVGVAATYAVMKSFNVVMEAVGQSSEDAERRLAGFNEELEEARGRAQAAGMAVKLFDTSIRMLTGRGVPGAEVSRLLSVLGDLEEPFKLSKAEADRIRTAALGGDDAGVREGFARVQEAAMRERLIAQQQAFEAAGRQVETIKAEIARLESSPFGSESKLAELRNQLQQSTVRKTSAAVAIAEGEAADHSADASERKLAALERSKVVLSTMLTVYEQMRGADASGRLVLERSKLRVESMALAGRAGKLRRTVSDANQADAGRAAEADVLEAEARKIREAEMRASRAAGAAGGARFVDNAALRRASEMEDRAAALRKVDSPDAAEARAELKAVEERRKEVDRNLEQRGSEEARKAAEIATALEDARRRASVRSETAGVGESETARMYDRQLRLVDMVGSALRRVNNERGTALERARAAVEAEQYLNDAIENGLAMRERGLKVQQQLQQTLIDRQREYSRLLLGSTNSDLLKQLGVEQFVQRRGGRVSPNDLVALGDEGRNRLRNLPGFGDAERDLGRELAETNRLPRGDIDNLRTDRNRMIDRLPDVMKEQMDLMSQFTAGASNAALGLELVSRTAVAAAKALDLIANPGNPATEVNEPQATGRQ